MRTIDARLGGVGDLAVALWIAEGARRAGDSIGVVSGSRGAVTAAFGHAEAASPSDDALELGTDSPAYQTELRTAEDASPRTVRWQRTVGWEYAAARPVLGDLGAEARAFAAAMAEPGRPLVVIAPRTDYVVRRLPSQKWLRVAIALEAAGVRTVAIDGRKSAVEAFPHYAHGFGWASVLALLARAAVVAGNDSGIPHLSATLGIPTVAAVGPTDPRVVFGHALDAVTPLRTAAVPCAGCHFLAGRGYGRACDHGCEALQTLPWEAVRDAILARVGGEKA